MEDAAKQFARRILLIHLALLAGVVGVVFFASREVYEQTRAQAMEQSKARQTLLAAQTARGIEAFYHSIFNDLDLLRQADRDDDEDEDPAAAGDRPATAPTTRPTPGPRVDWRTILRLDGPPAPGANAAFQNL